MDQRADPDVTAIGKQVQQILGPDVAHCCCEQAVACPHHRPRRSRSGAVRRVRPTGLSPAEGHKT